MIDYLRETHKALCAVILPLTDTEYRTQFHPSLSPLGWHLGHTLFIEHFWLRETILNMKTDTKAHNIYMPPHTPKSQRGNALPYKDILIETAPLLQQEIIELLLNPPLKLQNHAFMKEQYIVNFLVQHHTQHLETMHFILTEKNIQQDWSNFTPTQQIEAVAVNFSPITFAQGEYTIGNDEVAAFDNESPQHKQSLDAFAINQAATSNAEFLSFIHDDGYHNASYWSKPGWAWQQQTQCNAPNGWCFQEGNWFGIDAQGPFTIQGEAAVSGLSYYEAQAFANWADARLAHEYEIEVAYKLSETIEKPQIWEWCANTFHPYLNFRPFPYQEYSQNWFDDNHYTLKGGSPYTSQIIRRPSFRNFYQPNVRHIYAGIRLAVDD